MIHEMIEIEARGRPTALIVSGRFEGDAIASSKAFGMPDVRYVVVPHIYRNLDPQRSIEQTEAVFDALIEALTTNETGRSPTAAAAAPAEVERFEGEGALDAFDAMNREYIDRDWGDGFPLMPATSKAMETMLAGTSLPPDHVLCDLPPGYGIATVEKIAVNAAMAGALPEHMPVIIGALEAVSRVDPVHMKGFLMSTSANASLLLVNGPIAGELGINSKAACMGPGRQNKANLAIGRAYTLCLKNIGSWYPGLMDMDTIGSTRKFTVCIAENEEMSPWEPYHVEQGFDKDDSVVTLFATAGEVDVADQGNYSAEGLLKTIAYNSIFSQWDLATVDAPEKSKWETIVLVPPDVARPIGEAEFSKRAAKEFIHEHARFSLGKMKHYHPLKEDTISPSWRWLLDKSEEELDEMAVPVRQSAGRYQLICAGADRAKPMIIPSSPIRPVSANVDHYRSRRESGA